MAELRLVQLAKALVPNVALPLKVAIVSPEQPAKALVGIALAQAEHDYKICLREECLKLRSKGEANAFYHKIKNLYPDSYVVKSKIKYPKLADEGGEK